MTVYFWKDNQVDVIDGNLTVLDFYQSSMFKYLYCPCVDTNGIDVDERYGMFIHEGGGWLAQVRWGSLPITSFPPEFRTHLLLLGVS
jgi:hypothetical protein